MLFLPAFFGIKIWLPLDLGIGACVWRGYIGGIPSCYTIDGGGEHESPAFDHTQPPTAVAPKQDTLDTLEVLAVQEGAK